MKLNEITLEDKYELSSGRVFLTGMQALVRLPMMQRQRDLAAGLNTAGFISGYRGSPLGGYDSALWQAKGYLEDHHVKFQPGVNEDLAVTAVWGTQQIGLWPGAQYDGVFGIWYGKGPGVDRSGDALKHVNFAGSSRHGGVLAVAGDDHGSKSSTLPHQSEYAFMSSFIPVIHPASVQEYIDLGLYGFAMSRYSGCWTGFKAVGETVESTTSVDIDPNRLKIVLPTDFELPEGGLNIRYPDYHMDQEARLLEYKLPAAQAFARANGLDRIIMDAPKARLGIITTGKAYLDVRQALDEMGIDENTAAQLGLRLYKVALTWPLEPQGALEFAKGLEEILVVEEKRPLIEDQLTKLLFHHDGVARKIVGKQDENGRPLLPENGELNPGMIAHVLVDRLNRAEIQTDLTQRFTQRLARLDQAEAAAKGAPPGVMRTPYFCSGCPHNSSTKVPEGSRAMAGIGCHGMALWVPTRNTQTITHMGAEGVNWVGQAPFVNTKHVFQNLGDGTYFHSGLLAIRATIDAGVNITYKVLFNDAVAMTGGQPVVNNASLTPDEITRQVHAEGVKKIIVVTDEPDKYPTGTNWAPGTTIRHRDDLDAVQKELREIPGVTILLYDQTCAAELRRRRKRGLIPEPTRRPFINEAVCEGCGDCVTTSNCVSVNPSDTELGRKRRIDQSNCNKDFSCINGFCPSFVTVHGGTVRKAKGSSGAGNSGTGGAGEDLFADLPTPRQASAAEPYGILVTGIGGTGVITIGALLGMAAHIEGKGVSILDATGLSQKNGAVMSHVRIADNADDLHAVRIASGGAGLLLACDMMVAASPEATTTINQGRTSAVINDHVTPPAAFVIDQTIDLSGKRMATQLTDALGSEHAHFVNATTLATALLGDSIGANLFMVGFAYQKGLLPLSAEAMEKAIRLNNVAVDFNLRAFAWGRLAAHDPIKVIAIAAPLMPNPPASTDEKPDFDAVVAYRVSYLEKYQNAAYGAHYSALVHRAQTAEQQLPGAQTAFADAVARNLFKLMAYKDEYEVARLHSDPAFKAALDRQFEGDYKLSFHMAPPLLARRNPDTGHLIKQEFGAWMLPALRLVAKFKFLRGGPFDLFGRSAERREERRLITDYEATLEELMAKLKTGEHSLAVEIAEIPDDIKGFGHVKDANLSRARSKWDSLMAEWRNPGQLKADAAE